MDQQTQTPDQNELLPLLVLAPRPPGSAEPLAKSATEGERPTMLYRSEFGYDCRYDSPQQSYVSKSYDREGPKKSWFGIIATVSILLAIGLVALQPATRDAIGGFFSGHHSAAPTPRPTPEGGVLGTSTNDNSGVDSSAATDPGAPTDKSSSSDAAATGTPPATGGVVLSGSYSVAAGGKATTTCNQGVAGGGICTWTINHTAGNSMGMKVAWTGSAKVNVNVGDTVGNVYYSGTSSKSPISAPITNSGQSINITVTITGTAQTNFTVTLT